MANTFCNVKAVSKLIADKYDKCKNISKESIKAVIVDDVSCKKIYLADGSLVMIIMKDAMPINIDEIIKDVLKKAYLIFSENTLSCTIFELDKADTPEEQIHTMCQYDDVVPPID